jgi:hypothetical protein
MSFAKKETFKKKIGRKIASVYQESEGNKVFSKFLKCKSIEKSEGYIQKAVSCMSDFFDKDMSDSKKIDFTVFMLSGKNFSSLAKCDFETLERHPSVIKTENDFVLCSDFTTGSRDDQETAIFFFELVGKDLKIVNIKD